MEFRKNISLTPDGVYRTDTSWRTRILNVIGMLTGIGIIVGICSKAYGGNFFMWEKKSIVALHKNEDELLPEAGDILGIPKHNVTSL